MASDLWHALWHLIESKSLNVTLRWVKGHCDSHHLAQQHSMSMYDIYGNFVADRLADRAAEAYEVSPQMLLTCSGTKV